MATAAYLGQGFTGRQDSVVAEMISAMDSPAYPRIALQALARLVPVDGAAMFIYSGNDLVYLVDDELGPLTDSGFVDTYRTITYRFSPLFQHHQRGIVSGTYPMGQLARAQSLRRPVGRSGLVELDADEEIGYRTTGFPRRCSELAVALRLSPTETAHIALYRAGHDVFRADELGFLRGINQTLGATYGRFWKTHGPGAVTRGTNPVLEALQSLSNGVLSNRETHVLLLDLEGCNAREIGRRLGISEETVKTHRKRGFGKIGLRSKSELFLAVLRVLSPRIG